MKPLDIFIQNWRIRLAAKQIHEHSKVIDIGASNGELFDSISNKLSEGFGVEPLLKSPIIKESYQIQPGFFPEVQPDTDMWDAVVMLAVIEHIPLQQQKALAQSCHKLLKPGGLVIITVPDPIVDQLLNVLKMLKLVDGMSLEEHFGFQPNMLSDAFSPDLFKLDLHYKFQFGLNNLFVFKKITGVRL